jgi:hypothetical protein
VVIAWGDHVGSRLDWGVANASVDINGSPYHWQAAGANHQMKVTQRLSRRS